MNWESIALFHSLDFTGNLFLLPSLANRSNACLVVVGGLVMKTCVVEIGVSFSKCGLVDWSLTLHMYACITCAMSKWYKKVIHEAVIPLLYYFSGIQAACHMLILLQ